MSAALEAVWAAPRGRGWVWRACRLTAPACGQAGVAFQKRPDEGRMKGLAFCLDPDGRWVGSRPGHVRDTSGTRPRHVP